MNIAVVGSGYVGLVASACFAELGHDVICVDNDPEKLAALNRGETPIHEQYLPELLGRHRGHRLKFSGSLPDAVFRRASFDLPGLDMPDSRRNTEILCISGGKDR